MSTPCIVLNNVCCQIGGQTLLDIPALTVLQGERVAVIGHNGAGKSTLFKVLTGFVQPTHGNVQVLGRSLGASLDTRQWRLLRREIGQVMQGLHLVGRLSALHNVLIGALGRVGGWRSWTRFFPAAEIQRAEAALQQVGMLARAATRADQLSGGEKQKVGVARMLMQSPRLILADEPTAALDPTAAAEVCQLLVAAAAGATLLTVVHNPVLLPVLADRVIGLRQGRVVFDLSVSEVGDRQLVDLYRPLGSGFTPYWQVALPVPLPHEQRHST
ncbi:MAG: ATP-binding cassette domain-containing protein [Simplicispira suum]|uniref:phosphonate ABC transporter ATP-binding protein n=1 Tax=Simplicispira suum TaxID=2109915 RepID=UPI001C6ADD1E|nr:ATP-binding cassette domain-containing protein [Simplicispira suum]MBW7833006.1 ATP-binding cassette domain-containing protein [Simplicispira suum]